MCKKEEITKEKIAALGENAACQIEHYKKSTVHSLVKKRRERCFLWLLLQLP